MFDEGSLYNITTCYVPEVNCLRYLRCVMNTLLSFWIICVYPSVFIFFSLRTVESASL